MEIEREQAHVLVDLLPVNKLAQACALLDVLVNEDDEKWQERNRAAMYEAMKSMTKEDRDAMLASAAESGLTLEQLGYPPDLDKLL